MLLLSPKNRWLLLFCSFFALLSATACKKQPTKSQDLSQKFSIDEIQPAYMVTRGKATFGTKGKELTTTVDIRMAKDSLIWLNARVAFIEGARILIRQDSAFVLDKIARKYYAYSFEELSQVVNFDLNFALIQNLLLGNLPLKDGNIDAIKEENAFVIKQQDANYKSQFSISRLNKKLTKIQIESQKDSTQQLAINYSEFLPVVRQLFAHTLQANINYQKDNKPETTTIEINHKKVDFPDEQPEFPFSIPKGYTRGTVGL
jgi:hypothetical protein